MVKDMKSFEIHELGFSNFQRLGPEVIRSLPSEPGVYVLRSAEKRMIGRLRGESDIFYLGSSLKSIRGRVKFYFKPGPTQWTSIRINSLLERYPVEIAFKPSSNPREEEYQLLLKYFQEHDELPPFNFSGGLKPGKRDAKKEVSPRNKEKNEQRIIAAIRGDQGYCDDCLSLKSNVRPRQQVNLILRRRTDILRMRERCPGCGKIKIINKLKT